MARSVTAVLALLAAATSTVAQSHLSIANSFTTSTNGTISIPSSLATAGGSSTSTVPGSTGVAVFTIAGVSYGATAVSGVAVIAGYTLTPGGAGALVGGDSVSAVSSGIVFDGQTALYSMAFVEAATTTTAASTTMTSTSTSTTGSSGTATGAATDASSSSTSSGLAAKATGMAAAAVGGVAGLMVVLA